MSKRGRSLAGLGAVAARVRLLCYSAVVARASIASVGCRALFTAIR